MKSLARLFRENWKVSTLFLVLALVYLWHSLTDVPTQAQLDKYNVTTGQLHLLALSVALPYVIIWSVGLIGYLRLHTYVKVLGKGKDAPGFRTVARGVFLFTLWLPVSTLVAALASRYYENHPSVTAELTWVVNYVNILVLLPAFYLINRGAEQLVKTTKARWLGLSHTHTVLFVFAMACYVFLTFHDAARSVAASADTTASYYQPDWIILLTIILPRIYMWYLGLSGAASMILYRREVKGTIYKLALRNVALGIAGVVTATIVLRIVQSLSTVLNDLSLALILLVVYVLLIIIGTGYVLIAKGAQQLQKIEDS
jgi:hypothetical protein